jgi:hypothetical protein
MMMKMKKEKHCLIAKGIMRSWKEKKLAKLPSLKIRERT